MIWSKLIYHDFSVRFSLACLTESRSTGYGLKDLGPLHELHIKVVWSIAMIWSKLIYHDFSVRFSLACLTESRSTGYGLKDLGPLHELHIKVVCDR